VNTWVCCNRHGPVRSLHCVIIFNIFIYIQLLCYLYGIRYIISVWSARNRIPIQHNTYNMRSPRYIVFGMSYSFRDLIIMPSTIYNYIIWTAMLADNDTVEFWRYYKYYQYAYKKYVSWITLNIMPSKTLTVLIWDYWKANDL